MGAFPQTIYFQGLNEPVGQEVELRGLRVEGDLPAELSGSFYRAVPDPAFAPMFDSDHTLSGDGMVSRLSFNADGTADFAQKYVETARYKAEKAAGKALFGKYRNPFTDDASVSGVDRTVANTTPVWHAGRLLMAKEDGRPYQVDPITLETIGSYDFGGVLKSETMTAHVRIDAATGELFFYGYEADGQASAKVAYCVVAADGTLKSEQWFDAPYCAMMHDFTISENYALFPIYPTTADLDRLKAGGEHWHHEPELDSWLGVMPRYGDVSEIKWFKGPKGCHSYHMMNAWEDAEGMLHFDACLNNTNAFAFIREPSGIFMGPQDVVGALTRWTVDPRSEGGEVTETIIGPPGDFPVIPAKFQGRRYPFGFMLSMNPALQGPPLFAGPVGVSFNMLLRLDGMDTPGPQVSGALALPPMAGYNEPVHVPAADPAKDGWLVFIVDQQVGDNQFVHEAWVVDAGNIGAGAVAKVHIPARLRPQVHGWWVPQAQLDAL
ncbi:MAG: carotenoid oxygenase [Novosphingobium sp. 32-60-15]|uniref:carotenoid oxygenase family protein n=1 Tax=unclassified Novosphingobium TaxID=2644732 RepID=UPI000BC65FF3|nr:MULTISPECIES: carotenoid oxygenase family protein [unclassified Novosphingobium]OYX60956.1 MAG: carotenoid oxygenase [Novosphingobium sp. 32-60-15]